MTEIARCLWFDHGAAGQRRSFAVRPFTPTEAIGFLVLTDEEEETDRYGTRKVEASGKESACGWCKARRSHSWQITPRRLMDLTSDPDRDAANCAMEATMMGEIDTAALETAAAGHR